MIAFSLARDRATTIIYKGRTPAAFTLLELLVSLSITSVLMVGLAGALTVGLRNSRPTQTFMADAEAIQLADRFLTDVACSKSFEKASPHEIQFTVSGRTDESVDDRIRYEWTGAPNFEVRRALNDEPFQSIADKVTLFELDYLTRPPVSVDSPIWESPEMLLMEHDLSPSGSLNSYSTSMTRFCAQWFKPILHPDAISWKVTRVEVVMRKSAAITSSLFKVGICDAVSANNWPERNALTESTMAAQSLPDDFDWVNVDLPDFSGLSPEFGYCLRIAPSFVGLQPRVQFETSSQPVSPRNQWLISTNSGSSWSTSGAANSMRFRVYGTMTLQAW